jgi:hypothetical protein
MEHTFSKPNKNHPRPFLRYNNVSIMEAGSEKYPTMVTIHRAPAWGRSLIGKNYITVEHATKAISLYQGENIISKLSKTAKNDLVELGLGGDTAYAW